MSRLLLCAILVSTADILVRTAIVDHSTAAAADLRALREDNWDAFVPQGKEVDAIYGDFVLRNEHVVAVIAQPLASAQRQHDRPRRRRLPDRPDRDARPRTTSSAATILARDAINSPARTASWPRCASIGKRSVGPARPTPSPARRIALEFDAQPIEGRPQLTGPLHAGR